jgi:hypothetical protein
MGKADPAAVVPPAVGRCYTCGARFVRGPTGWACPTDLGHVRILSDAHLLAQVKHGLPRHGRPVNMSPHQWGWYKSRRAEWAARVVRELARRPGGT